MRSSYLRVLILHIHPSLELTLLQLCSVGIKLFLALSYRQDMLPYLYDAACRCNQPAQAGSGRVETVNLEFNALALLILNATGLPLTCELPQLFLGHQMA
jgi:hypothetical protein